MDAFIKKLRIKNFKSIKEMELNCERINLFIGEPNVGKSNILEAVSLLGSTYSVNPEKFLSEFMRYDEISNLFHFEGTSNAIEVESNIGAAYLRHLANVNMYDLALGNVGLINEIEQYRKIGEVMDYLSEKNKNDAPLHLVPFFYKHFYSNGKIASDLFDSPISPVKKYTFVSQDNSINHYSHFLLPPFGRNLYSIVEKNQNLKREFGKEFKKYGLELILDVKSKKFEIQKKEEDLSYKLPFSLVADTLQRFIFYAAAMESNNNSVVILEEIESHSFPRYVQELAQIMIDSKDNQFFATTHSPYLLNTVMSEHKDVAIFLATYEDFQTKVKRLDDAEISDLLNHGLDVFYNLKTFEHEQEQ